MRKSWMCEVSSSETTLWLESNWWGGKWIHEVKYTWHLGSCSQPKTFAISWSRDRTTKTIQNQLLAVRPLLGTSRTIIKWYSSSSSMAKLFHTGHSFQPPSGGFRAGHLCSRPILELNFPSGKKTSTPRKTNMSPKNQWLEDVFPIEIVHF